MRSKGVLTMKATRFSIALLLTLLSAILVSAQESKDPKDLTVLDHSWHKDYVGGRRDDTNPLQPNEDYIRQTRVEKQHIRQREEYSLPNQPTEARMPLPNTRPLTFETKPTDIYVYQFTVRNTGAKKIKAVEWEYQFLHPDTQEVMGSRRITSKVKLSPGKSDKIEARLIQKPTSIVAADQLGKKPQDQFTERVLIHRIVYTDGSVWQRAP